jgi:hypothetical protein
MAGQIDRHGLDGMGDAYLERPALQKCGPWGFDPGLAEVAASFFSGSRSLV